MVFAGRQLLGLFCDQISRIEAKGTLSSSALAPLRAQAHCFSGSVLLRLIGLFVTVGSNFFSETVLVYVCVFQLLIVVLYLCLTGRSYLGIPAWLGQHQQPQRPAYGPADVPLRYTNTVACKFLYCAVSFDLRTYCVSL